MAQQFDSISINFADRTITICCDNPDNAENIALLLSDEPEFQLMPLKPDNNSALWDFF